MKLTKSKLAIAIAVFTGMVVLAWPATSALTQQYNALNGCWPETTQLGAKTVLTVNFWLEEVRQRELGPVGEFFHSRVRHRLWLYIMLIGALIGWSGSVFLKIVLSHAQVDGKSSGTQAGWDFLVASMFLALIAALLLFLIVAGGSLMISQEDSCINEGVGFFSVIGSVAAGLFVVSFFDWFKRRAESIWGMLAGRPDNGDKQE